MEVTGWLIGSGDYEAFESSGVPEDWRSAVIAECKNYRGISLTVFRKIYAGILVDRVCTVIRGLIDDEQGGFRAERGCRSDLHTKADR